MITTKCAICQNKEILKVLYKENFDIKKIDNKVFSARRTPDKMHYRIVECQNCGLIFSNPVLEKSKLISLYSDSDFFYYIESEFLKKTYGYYLNEILSKDRKNLRLLDIGCGNGFLLEEAIKLGIKEVYGVEPGKASVEKAKKDLQDKIIVDIFKPKLFKKNFFDVICCFHTLDHIFDVNNFLEESYNILKDKGKIFFIVHDTKGLSVKLFREKSPIFDIEHIYLFNPYTLSKIFKAHGFKNIKIIGIKNHYPISYWTRMIPMPNPIKNFLLSLLDKTKVGKITLRMNPGNIGIIAEK